MEHELDASPIGIARLIKDSRLKVPAHQREYSWTNEEVDQLLTDVYTAFEKREDYFLGSIMLIKGESPQILHIVDGQQRLATVTILLSAIRNYFHDNDAVNERHLDIERDFLFNTDLRTRERDYNLMLSERDSERFEQILTDPSLVDLRSRELLVEAFKQCTSFVESILSNVNNPVERLLDLHDYLLRNVQVIAVKANNEASAYIIFETLNDRGLSLSLADLVKNYLFGLSGDRIELAKTKWLSMMGAFTAQDAEHELPDFIRYYWLSKHGYLNEKQLFNELKRKINSKAQAIQFVSDLEEVASFYLALDNSSHDVWRSLGPEAARTVRDINLIKFIQYKPLMLAVLKSIPTDRAKKMILTNVENWAVRLVYSSGTRSGVISEKFSEVAVKVNAREYTTAQEVIDAIRPIIPADDVFKEQFSSISVRSAASARYLLRKIENKKRATQGRRQELDVSEDINNVNLEHILPKNADLNNWNFDSDEHAQSLNRLGNQTLMLTTDNSTVGSDDYDSKREMYGHSELLITSQIADDFETWDKEKITVRQTQLAETAAQTWTI